MSAAPARGGLGRWFSRLWRTSPLRALATVARGGLLPALRGTLALRARATAPWLRGDGLEIGAGPHPQPLPAGCTCRYYDLRSADELRVLFAAEADAVVPVRPLAAAAADFPDGADFGIAHHVLEHCADPIGTLRGWHRLLRPGGTFVLSLPDHRHCADQQRPVPPLAHLLLDHLLERGEAAFESREHVYSFVAGWHDEGAFAGKDKATVARMAHECAAAPHNDCHWHAFDEDLGAQVIAAAARFDGHGVEFLARGSPDRPGAGRTLLDLLWVYRLVDDEAAAAEPAVAAAAAAMRDLALALARAQQRLPRG